MSSLEQSQVWSSQRIEYQASEEGSACSVQKSLKTQGKTAACLEKFTKACPCEPRGAPVCYGKSMAIIGRFAVVFFQ